MDLEDASVEVLRISRVLCGKGRPAAWSAGLPRRPPMSRQVACLQQLPSQVRLGTLSAAAHPVQFYRLHGVARTSAVTRSAVHKRHRRPPMWPARKTYLRLSKIFLYCLLILGLKVLFSRRQGNVSTVTQTDTDKDKDVGLTIFANLMRDGKT